MLELYFLKPATVDRILANVAGAYIEHYVSWLRTQGYADRNVLKRVPILCRFGEFASARGAIDGQTALAHVEAFAQHWQAIHGKSCKSDSARAKVAKEARNPVRQMLELVLHGSVGAHRPRRPFPFEAEAPGFAGYLRDERGLKASTVGHYALHLSGLRAFLDGAGAPSLSSLSPPLLAAFLVKHCAGLARTSRRDLCGALRVFLRYCHRERIIARDLSAAVQAPRIHRLSDLAGIAWVRGVPGDRVQLMVAHHGQRRAGVDHRAHRLDGLYAAAAAVDEVADEYCAAFGVTPGALALAVAQSGEQGLKLFELTVDVANDVVAHRSLVIGRMSI